MPDLFQQAILDKSQDTLYDNARKEWMILYKDHMISNCICGHKVKYISTIYNRITRNILEVGTFCCKKNGIDMLCTNQLLIHIHKEKIEGDRIANYIETEYRKIFESEKVDKYYRIVPLNKLLTDLVDLHTNYGISFMTYIEEIKQDIAMLEQEHNIYDEEFEESVKSYNESLKDDSDTLSDISMDLSLLSLETVSRDPSIQELRIQLDKTEKERCQNIDILTKCMYENEFMVNDLLRRIKAAKETTYLMQESVSDFRKQISNFSFIN